MNTHVLALVVATPLMALLTLNASRTGRMWVTTGLLKREAQPEKFRAYMFARIALVAIAATAAVVMLAVWGP